MNGHENIKIVNIFFHVNFPLYVISIIIIIDVSAVDVNKCHGTFTVVKAVDFLDNIYIIILLLDKVLHLNKWFLNQTCVDYRPVHAWFLEIALVFTSVCVCVCVCVSVPRAFITSGMIWWNIDYVLLVK